MLYRHSNRSEGVIMNKAIICGRLTRDVEIVYGARNKTAIGKTSIAVNRGKNKDGQDLGADFINIVVYGKQAENFANFKHKGDMVLIEGRITTGSYEKDGRKVYTTEITAEHVDFLTRETNAPQNEVETAGVQQTIPAGFTQLTDDDIPF